MNDYLKSTKFNIKTIPKFVRDYLGNMRVVILLIIALLAGGFLSYKSLPQTVAPEINIPMVVVSSALPGATPSDIETLLTIPIEDKLKDVSGIDTVSSTSQSNSMYSVLTFDRGINKSRALSDVENAVRRVENLPEDATDPIVKAVDFEDYPIIRLALSIDGDSPAALNSYTQKLINKLEENSLIDRVITAGQPKKEVQITLSSEKMSSLNISPQMLRVSIKSALATLPGGTVEDVQMARALTINTSINNIEDLRSLPLSINSKPYTLGDIATITERPAPNHTRAWFARKDKVNNEVREDTLGYKISSDLIDKNQTPKTTTRSIVTLDIHRTSGADLTEAAKTAEKIIDETIAQTNGKVHQTTLLNMSTDQVEQFNELVKNLGITILLVFLTLMLFVGWQQALLAAFSIPLTYAVALIVMNLMGLTINFLSLFSLLLSLGLLVDVTIVVVSAMSTYIKDGAYNSYKTGLLVYRDFFVTLLITTLTTIWAFVPLLLTKGMMGEYLRSIPIIVSSILLASVFVGIFIILPLMIWLFSTKDSTRLITKNIPSHSLVPRRVKIMLVIIGSALISFLIIFIFKLPIFFILIISVLVLLLGLSGKNLTFNKFFKDHISSPLHSNKKIAHSDKHLETSKILPPTYSKSTSIINIQFLQKLYKKILTVIINSKKNRRKTIAMVSIFFVFSFVLVATGFVKNEFFPGEDVDFFYVTMELPQGTKASITEKEAKKLLPTLTNLSGVTGATLQVGFGIDANSSISATTPNMALFTILTPKDKVSSLKIAQEARNLSAVSTFTKGKIIVSELTGGPPAGADVVVTFTGDDLTTLRNLANQLKQKINANSPNNEKRLPIENITISPKLSAATVEFIPNDTLLVNRGLTREAIAGKLLLFANGLTLADDVKFNNLEEKRDIVLRFDEKTPSLETLGRIMISTPNGNVPLESLGDLRLTQNVSKINRKDFDRTVTFSAGLVGKANLVEVNKKIAKIINSSLALPAGYSWTSGGANEENNKSVQSILQGMLLAFVLIFLTLIIHLKSYRKAILVLLTIPPAASGVFVIFAVTGTPLSFPALIGILALFGIVVNNAIIVVSQINANQKVGMSYKKSIIEGASSRLEPILLSSLTTIIGLLPITLSNPVWRGLGGSIIAGLLFSGTIMLFFIPTIYYAIMGDEKKDTTNNF